MKILLTFLSIFFIGSQFAALAEDEPYQAGDVSFEENTKENAYELTHQAVLKKLQELATLIEKGISSRPQSFDDSELTFIAASYLYCTTARGVCRELIQPVFETDVIESVLSGQTTCSNSLAFWRLWLKQDFEERAKRDVKTGNIQAVDQFNRTVRTRLIQCEKSISEILLNAKGMSGVEALKTRYADNTIERMSVLGAAKLLEAVNEKAGNVFVATGSTAPASDKSKSSSKSKSTGSSVQQKK